jgi:hypothetical protein
MATHSIDLEAIYRDVLGILQNNYGVSPIVLSVNMVLSAEQFDAIAPDHPDKLVPDLLQKSLTTRQPWRQWTVMIQRERRLEDFPPEIRARLTPPE